MNTAPLPHVCRQCHQPLSSVRLAESNDGVWVHVQPDADHAVDPVPRHEVNESSVLPVCDFCNTPSAMETSWVYGARKFEMHISGEGFDHIGSDDGEGWGACEKCHQLITRGDRTRLAARAATLGEQRGLGSYDFILKHISQSHDIFFSVATGECFPAREYRPS